MIGSHDVDRSVDIVFAYLLALIDLSRKGVVGRNGRQRDNVSLNDGVALSDDPILSLDQDAVDIVEIIRLLVLRNGNVELDDVALDTGGLVTVEYGEYAFVFVEVGQELNHGSLKVIQTRINVEVLPCVEGVDSLALGNFQIRSDGDLVADFYVRGSGVAVPVDDGNGGVVTGSGLGGSLSGSLGGFLGGFLSGSGVRAINRNFCSGSRRLGRYAVLNHSDRTGAEAVKLVDDLGVALSDDLEGHGEQNLLGREVIALCLDRVVAELAGSVVGNGNGTALDVGHSRGERGLVLIFVIGVLGDDRQLGRVKEYSALDLGSLALETAGGGGQTGQIQIEGVGDGVADMSVIGNALDLDGGAVAGHGSLGGLFGGLFGGLLSGLFGGLFSGHHTVDAGLQFAFLVIVPNLAVFDTGLDVLSLAGAVVENQTCGRGRDGRFVNSLTKAVVSFFNLGGSAGPAGSLGTPGISVHSAPAFGSGEVNGDGVAFKRSGSLSGRLGSVGILGGLLNGLLQDELEHTSAAGGAVRLKARVVALEGDVVDIAVFLGAVASGTEVDIIDTRLVHGSVVVPAIRIPCGDIRAALGRLDSFDGISGVQSHAGDNIFAFVICRRHQTVLAKTPVSAQFLNRTGQVIGITLDLCARRNDTDY